MKRATMQWISLTAAAAVLAAGCATGPQRRPEPRNPNVGNNVSTTTGDADACAVALGNSVAAGGTMTPGGGARPQEVTANGVIVGNVALVALPTNDQLPTTPSTTPPGTPVTPPTPPTPPNPIVTVPAPAGDPNAKGAPGGVMDNRYPGPVTGGVTGTVGGDADAVDRIKVACDKLADIRVVNTAGDRARLAQITYAIRQGQPITNFMADLSRMAQASTSAGGGRNANRGPGAPAAPGAPAGAPAPTPATPGMP